MKPPPGFQFPTWTGVGVPVKQGCVVCSSWRRPVPGGEGSGGEGEAAGEGRAAGGAAGA